MVVPNNSFTITFTKIQIGMPMPMAGSSTVGNVENFGLFQPELAFCPSSMKPCNGKIPCINTCGCPRKGQMLKSSGACVDISEEVSTQLINNYEDASNGGILSR